MWCVFGNFNDYLNKELKNKPSMLGETKLIFWSTKKAAKKKKKKKKKIKGQVGQQNKNNITWFFGLVFLKKQCIAETEEKPAVYNFYNNDKCFLVLVIYISLLCFISYFVSKSRK